MLKKRLKNLYLNRRILWDISLAQLKAKYAASQLGLWWALLVPLALALSINFIFTLAFKVNIPRYTLFVLSGIIPWFFISSALTEANNSFIAGASILKQGIFPREILPASCVLSGFLNFIIGFLIILPVFVIADPAVMKLSLFLVAVLAMNLIFVLGLGLIFSTVNVFFRDMSQILGIGLMLWFWVTPVFYSSGMLAFPYRWVCLVNPASYFIDSYRQILYSIDAPGASDMGVMFVISFSFLLIGYGVFLKNEAQLLKKI
jgi:ABC-type polysaccharide/polyol phosphate export permease